MASVNPTIFFHPEAFNIDTPKLMGRNAAGHSFLKAFLQYTKHQCHWIYSNNSQFKSIYSDIAKASNRFEEIRLINQRNLSQLSNSGLLFYPGPDISHQARFRSSINDKSWSLCGITHTTSSIGAMESLSDLIVSPVYPWDAIICTSQAVKYNVNSILQNKVDYLQERLGISKMILPELPIIPLGINSSDFSFNKLQILEARVSLSIDSDEVVVLYVGRLSFHAKAHPFAMYKALEAAQKETTKKLVLIECGWFANDAISNSFTQAFNYLSPSVRRIVLDGRKAVDRNNAWAAADIFCSLSDNIQETFGITPVEAMASGLPVIASEWNGYKESIRHEKDGFLIPTCMPSKGLGSDLAIRHFLGIDTYDMYCGHTSSLVSIDISLLTSAFVQLINSPKLRKEMGLSGKERVSNKYDWSILIPQYQELWNQLSKIRQQSIKDDIPSRINQSTPSLLDPFQTFSHYKSETLNLNSVLRITKEHDQNNVEQFKKYVELLMVNYVAYLIPKIETQQKIFTCFSDNKSTVRLILEKFPPAEQPTILRSLFLLLKLGVVELER